MAVPNPDDPGSGNGWVYFAQIAIAALVCLPLFDRLDYYGRSDWDQFTVRYETPRVAILRDRQLPLWNPYVNGGTALLAHPHCPAASPWFLPVLILGAPIGLRVQVLLFMALGATGMAAFLRHWGIGRAGCFLGGILFMMGSHFPLHIAEGHLEWCVLGLMPWLVLCFLLGATSRRFLIAAGLLLASILTFGSVYIPAVFLPCLALWTVLESLRRKQPRLTLLGCGVFGIGLSIAAVKLVPQVEFTGAFPRPAVSEGFSPRGLAVVFFDPRQELLYRAYRDVYLPPEHADLKTIPDSESLPIAHRLAKLGFHWSWHEYGCYITWLGMALAFLGMASSWKSQWPMYAVGGVALLLAMGHGSPVNVYGWLQRLPFYASMHVPARFLAFVLFALAVAAAHGLDWLCRWVGRTRLSRLETPLAWLIPVVIAFELGVMGWKLFDDIFVSKPRVLPVVREQEFATRIHTTAHRDPRMMSYLYPFLKSNTGVLEGYENLAVPQGHIRLEGKPGYRGECYLEESDGSAKIQKWTMNRVKVAITAPSSNRLVLNQNFDSGWRAVVTGSDGIRGVDASANSGGLVSTPVEPGDREVEFYYLPSSFVWGAWISGLSLVVSSVLWFAPASLFRRAKSAPLDQSAATKGSPYE